jgi:hypothetical protein
VLECVGNGEISSQALLEALAPATDDHLYWLPVIWSMLLTRHLTTDLDRPLTNDVPLRRMGVDV